MTRPRLLDLFCGAGGAAMGYHRAGFDVVGVDNRPQPRYPFEFRQADALDLMRGLLAGGWIGGEAGLMLRDFDAIHASPPCQDHMRSPMPGQTARGTSGILAMTRERLQASGLPWVMENVAGAPLTAHIVLCGTMFGLTLGDEWELRRHRLFETSGHYCLTVPCQHRRRALGVYGSSGGGNTKHGHKATAAQARRLMQIDWMTQAELSQAIPPAYTQFIGVMLREEEGGRDHDKSRDAHDRRASRPHLHGR